MGRGGDDLGWWRDLKRMDGPTQLLGVGLGVGRGGESGLVTVECEKGRGVQMSRQTENAGFFARFQRKAPYSGAEEIPNHMPPPGLDIFARYRTSNCTWPLRGKICLL